jgi:pimeloyl-ACP methyl ester carboxylesterase
MRILGCSIFKFALVVVSLISCKQPQSSLLTAEDPIASVDQSPCGFGEVVQFTNGTTQLKALHLQGKSDLPTLVILLGGPGQDISSVCNQLRKIASDYNSLVLEVRGIGLNANAWSPNTRLTLSDLASDVVALTKSLVTGPFVISGASFGTVVATMAAHKLESEAIDSSGNQSNGSLKGVVLTGTLSRSFESREEALKPFVQGWSRFLQKQANRDLVRNAIKDFPVDSDGTLPRKMGQFLSGAISTNPSELHLVFDGEFPLYKVVSESTEEDPLGQNPVYRELACSSLLKESPLFNFVFNFKTLDLSIARPDHAYCSEIPWASYRAVDYPIQSPVVYIQGEFDPNTPSSHATRHYKTVPKGKKFLLQVPGGGHSPLTKELSDCWPILFSSIFSGTEVNLSGLGQFEKACRWYAYYDDLKKAA